MIHPLAVTSEMTPTELRKRARKLAMQGGYELCLDASVSPESLETVARMYLAELSTYAFSVGDARWDTNIATRVLRLIANRAPEAFLKDITVQVERVTGRPFDNRARDRRFSF